jgi:hypothetical protein
MDKKPNTAAEVAVSKTKEEIIKESKRIEEGLLYSSKGHFAAAHFWKRFHLWIGVPIVVLSAIAGASALSEFDTKHVIASVIAIVTVSLSSLMTFLNPNEKSSAYLNAANSHDALMNRVRIFLSIDCWGGESDQVLTERLKYFSEQKCKLKDTCPQIPRWAYLAAKKGIDAGEAEYAVDKDTTGLAS